MKIVVSEKTRETIDKEFSRFMADPNNLARLKMKLTYNQRVFIENLQQVYNEESGSMEAEDKLLLFQEAILTFNARPELVPNAPIDMLRKSINFKNTPDDFEELIVMIKVWKNSLRRSKRPVNKLGVFFGAWPKPVLYAAFVAILTTAFMALLNVATHFYIYSNVDFAQLTIAVITGFLSIASGKGIYFRLLTEKLM
ncbi:hypothetical protein SAMN02910298_01580 [Pseudobutyrivibrio sp. YE44]|uniref:hypothetical protein n=1 Tax=Pseudobutyrivibrio sp. YE44 TaxID=1520802 RepID=UPI00088EA756|nr:hypothetical protein [Pseudobutyrivibrio sp. YE44]SDB32863.1 hypothetical protein SAMN02910298_01580 [Pseudobutyrivibrio sp. YE44]